MHTEPMHTDSILPPLRRGALLTAPIAFLSLVLFGGALAVHGDDIGAVSRSALGIGSAALALVSVALLMLALVHLTLTRPALQDRPGKLAAAVAGAGTLLLSGGAWAQLVVAPALAVDAPEVASQGTPLITAGYIASFLLTGIGWFLVALRLRRDDGVARGHVRLLLAGAILMVVPLPTRWFVLAVAVALIARHVRMPAVATRPVPATA